MHCIACADSTSCVCQGFPVHCLIIDDVAIAGCWDQREPSGCCDQGHGKLKLAFALWDDYAFSSIFGALTSRFFSYFWAYYNLPPKAPPRHHFGTILVAVWPSLASLWHSRGAPGPLREVILASRGHYSLGRHIQPRFRVNFHPPRSSALGRLLADS